VERIAEHFETDVRTIEMCFQEAETNISKLRQIIIIHKLINLRKIYKSQKLLVLSNENRLGMYFLVCSFDMNGLYTLIVLNLSTLYLHCLLAIHGRTKCHYTIHKREREREREKKKIE